MAKAAGFCLGRDVSSGPSSNPALCRFNYVNYLRDSFTSKLIFERLACTVMPF